MVFIKSVWCMKNDVKYDKIFKMLKDRYVRNSNTKQNIYNMNMYDWENDKALRETPKKMMNYNDMNHRNYLESKENFEMMKKCYAMV